MGIGTWGWGSACGGIITSWGWGQCPCEAFLPTSPDLDACSVNERYCVDVRSRPGEIATRARPSSLASRSRPSTIPSRSRICED